MISRDLETVIIELLEEFRIVYLTGPRQAGKTTLVRKIAEKRAMEYLTLDNQAIRAAANNDPHGLINSYENRKLVLDEFQYCPDLIPAIKENSDQLSPSQKGKFLLTGSTDIFRSAKTQEALPGHMARLELYPLSLSEKNINSNNKIDQLISQQFKLTINNKISREELASWIVEGGYPEVQSKSPRAKSIWYSSYVSGRLFKDFESLYNARGDYFSRLQALIPYLAGLSGNLIKYANISNDLLLDDKLTKSYLQILELMFIVKRVPAYIKNRAKRKAVQMQKLHFIDTGLGCHLLGIKTHEQLINSQYYGGLLETFIFMELVKDSQWSINEINFYHFRDKQKNEVDIVMESADSRIIGIEVKASASVSIHDFKGLMKLAEFSGELFNYGIVFYTGSEILPFNQQGKTLYALPIGLLK